MRGKYSRDREWHFAGRLGLKATDPSALAIFQVDAGMSAHVVSSGYKSVARVICLTMLSKFIGAETRAEYFLSKGNV